MARPSTTPYRSSAPTMAWLQGLRQALYSNPSSRAIDPRTVVAPLMLDARASHRLEQAVGAWVGDGCSTPFAPPDVLPVDLHQTLMARLAHAQAAVQPQQQPMPGAPVGVRVASAAERVAAGRSDPNIAAQGSPDYGRDDLLRSGDKRPKWKKRGWVGPGGARATAERRAKEQGHAGDEAYIGKIYAQMVGHKSARSGALIPHANDALYRSAVEVEDQNPVGYTARVRAAEALRRALPAYSAADHMDAAALRMADGEPQLAALHARAAAQVNEACALLGRRVAGRGA